MTHRMVVAGALAFALMSAGAPAGSDPLPGGTFDPYVAHRGGGQGLGVAAADLNGDGLPDVALNGVGTMGGTVNVAPGLGDLNFGPATVHGVYSYPRSVAAGDLNGDGRSDLAVTARTQVDILQQTAAGTLVPAGSLPVEAEKVKIADVTGDDRADVVVIGWDNPAVVVYAQTPGGLLGAAKTYSVPLGGYNDLELGDVDGDKDTDVVAMSGQSYGIPNITVLLQQPDRNLSVRGSYNLPTPPGPRPTSGIGLGDVDGDGLAEVVASSQGYRGDQLTVFDAAADGSLAPNTTFSVTNGPEPVEVADMNLDGYDDAVVAHGGWNTVSIYYGSPAGLTRPGELLEVPMASHYDPHGLALVDLDLDGDRDIVLASSQDFLVFRNRSARSDLSLNFSSIGTAKVGDAVIQTLTVTNQGTVDVSGRVRVDIPSLLKVQHWSDPGCAYAGGSLTCQTGSLAKGKTYNLSVLLRAYAPGTGETRASLVSTSRPDADSSDDASSVAVVIRSSPTDAQVRSYLDQLVRLGALR